MKTCKDCRQIVNIETVTCPNCEGHEFKLNPVKICSLCGKVNEKKNSECELCGKSFSQKANEYTISTVMNLALGEGGAPAGQKAAELEEPSQKRTLKEKYFAIKAEIEAGENEDRCAYFIPEEINERPIVLLPSFEESNKVDVYLVLNNKEMPSSIGMEKIDISKEEDMNTLNTKKASRRKTGVAAFFLFWMNLAMICAFGLKIGGVMGFQIIAAIFNSNPAGQGVIDLIKASSSFGNVAYFIYLILLIVLLAELILSLAFLRTKFTKAKKVVLIIMQSVIFAFVIGVFLINPLMLDLDWLDLGEGLILLLAFGLLGLITSMFYQYSKDGKQKEKKSKAGKKEKLQKEHESEDSQFIGLGEETAGDDV